MTLLLTTLVAYAVSAVLIRFVLLSPQIRERLLSQPTLNRWHSIPTPSFGGIPMFIGVTTALVVTWQLGDRLTWGLLAGAGVLFVLGVLDDWRDIKPKAKLAGQVTAAALVVLIGGGGLGFSLGGSLVVMALIVLMANSVNLLDNMDGLAGGTTLVSLMVMLPVVLASTQTGLAQTVTAVIGAVAGFLVFNMSPARVFMGDSGSMWLGLVLAATVATADYGEAVLIPLAAATILAVPLLDTATVVYSRLRHGRSITHGGSDHLSHRLVRLGLRDTQAVLALTVAAGACGLIGVSVVFLSTPTWVVSVAVLWSALILAVARLAQVPVYQTYPAEDLPARG